MTKPTLFPRPFKLSRDWMDAAEQRTFERMLETGQITFFRTQRCGGPECDKDVPKVKLFCSIECKKTREDIDKDSEKDTESHSKGEGHAN